MTFIWGSMRATASPETSDGKSLADFLERCAALGCSQIDLADIYGQGRCEELMGEAFSVSPDLRSRFSLIAKSAVVFASGKDKASAHHYRNDAGHLEASLATTLRRLGSEQIDLFLVHRPDYLLEFDETARALERMVTSGRVRQIGVSNFPADRLARLEASANVPIAHHQIEFSVLETACLDNGLLDEAQTARRSISAWSPFGGGRLFDIRCETAARVRNVLAEIAGDDDPNVIAGTALAWIRYHPVAPVPILGGTRIERIEHQVKAMKTARFDPERWYAVLEASRGQPVP
ncbi:aldo/keto reductase [Hyphobacterium sp. HN65]|uniref:Aldo/keto reductase n=1 Tax=Hyphobacterium lacteum TaxID=3116575 RepID=A0ABU7LSK5_9PROT|nr:aldo/keto reductase [Hyphobacterium sp. HN65]MEE2526845.1 aldo/keto reductase [Hyphobacterium sp. HN65]